MNLTYEVKENGYVILKDGEEWISQYEPYIPDRSKTYEENALLQIEELCKEPEPTEDEKMKEQIELIMANIDFIAMETGIEL